MKRWIAILMTLLFLISTSGVSVHVHYCGGEVVSMSVNGLGFTTAEGMMMGGDCQDNDGCPNCQDVMQHHQVESHFAQGQSVSVYPLLAGADWFHGALALFCPYFDVIPAEEGSADSAFAYVNNYLSCAYLPHCGLRAPPIRN